MRKREQLLYDALKRNTNADRFWLHRLENLTGRGTPDVVLFGFPHALFVELKAVQRPVRFTTRFLKRNAITADQYAWHRQCATHGGRSCFLIRDDHNILYVLNGRFAHGQEEASLAEFELSHRQDTWSAALICMELIAS